MRAPGITEERAQHDLLEMIRSEAKWDKLFADPRSDSAMEQLLKEANLDSDFDFDPATRPAKAAE